MKIQNALVSNILDRSQRNFAHVTTVALSWRVQNIVVIGRVYCTLECFEFSSNFEFDRNMLSGTGARTHHRILHETSACDSSVGACLPTSGDDLVTAPHFHVEITTYHATILILGMLTQKSFTKATPCGKICVLIADISRNWPIQVMGYLYFFLTVDVMRCMISFYRFEPGLHDALPNYALLRVNHTGFVTKIDTGILKSRCWMHIIYFPLDTQNRDIVVSIYWYMLPIPGNMHIVRDLLCSVMFWSRSIYP